MKCFSFKGAYHVNMLLAGYDTIEGPQLFFMDYLASLINVKYAAHGYGGYFSLSILDRYYLDNLDRNAAYDLMKKCVKEVHQRLIVNLPNFKVQLVDSKGIEELPPITVQSLAENQ